MQNTIVLNTINIGVYLVLYVLTRKANLGDSNVSWSFHVSYLVAGLFAWVDVMRCINQRRIHTLIRTDTLQREVIR